MYRLAFLFIAVLLTTNVYADSTCPAIPATISCQEGVMHVTPKPLPQSFYISFNGMEGKSCKKNNLTLVFTNAYEAYAGWGLACYYQLPGNTEFTLALSSREYQHSTGNWTWDYNWRWQCWGPDVGACMIKRL